MLAPKLGLRRGLGLAGAGLAVCIVAALGVLGFTHLHARASAEALLATPPEQTATRKDLVRFAVAQGRPLYAADCAACHGADMKGLPGPAPNFTDRTWLYGDGEVYAIERTILYGIRSTEQKSHNVTEMPAFGLRGQLGDADIRNVVQYVRQLSHQSRDPQAALAGRPVFNETCADCHGLDGTGNSDYGAPDLTADAWLYGGDPGSLYRSVYSGRHGAMPGYIGRLSLAQIRALAVYIHVVSHPANAG